MPKIKITDASDTPDDSPTPPPRKTPKPKKPRKVVVKEEQPEPKAAPVQAVAAEPPQSKPKKKEEKKEKASVASELDDLSKKLEQTAAAFGEVPAMGPEPIIIDEDDEQEKLDPVVEQTASDPEPAPAPAPEPPELAEAAAEQVPAVHSKSIPITEEQSEQETIDVEHEPDVAAEIEPIPAPAPLSPQASELEEEPNDPLLDQAVEDITRSESDELLEQEDEDQEQAFVTPSKESFSKKIGHLLGSIAHSRALRWGLVVIVVAALGAVAVFPTSRYTVLDAAGVRASASVSIVDDKTQLPLKGVHVLISGMDQVTDAEGTAHFSGLKLGTAQMTIQKLAFAPQTQQLVLGWGSNPLGNYPLTAVGSRYTFEVTDWLTKKPLQGVEADSGEGSALSDSSGRVELVLGKTDAASVKVDFSLDSYRDESLSVAAGSKAEQPLAMVPAAKQLFVSKRSGKYDVYKVDVDGKNEKLLVTGTGTERDDLVLASQPGSKQAALISTRDNEHDSDGYLMSDLYIIDAQSGELQKVNSSDRIQAIDWIGDRLVYVMVAQGASGANPNRHRLMSYDTDTRKSIELASSNYFNDVLSADGRIYYAPSNAFSENSDNAKLFSVAPDGSDRQTILDQETWNIFRLEYNKLTVSVGQDWYSYALGGTTTSKLAGPPAQLSTRVYVDNSNRSQSLWVDSRDGKGVLLLYDVKSGTDKVLQTQIGLTFPVRWLNDRYVIYRVVTPQETADYVISSSGGTPVKISDVSNVDGIDKWFFY